MIYNIPYNQNFIKVLCEKAKDSLLILPSKYLTDEVQLQSSNKCLSYDDLWFQILSKRVSHVEEAILLNHSLQFHNSSLKQAVNEYYYYGLEKLICLNGQHDLFQQTILKLNTLLQSNNKFMRANTLQKILSDKEILIRRLKFIKSKIYAVLPVIFSPILFQILKILYEELQINIVLYGYDSNAQNVSEEHSQYFLQEFIKTLKPDNIIELIPEIHNINIGIQQLMSHNHCEWHKNELYNFDHISRVSCESITQEFESISNIIAKTNVKTISIVTKDVEKMKMLYQYLLSKFSHCTITTSAPVYCYDIPHFNLFLQILEFPNAREIFIADIFAILSIVYPNEENLLKAEKFLLQINELNNLSIDYIQELLKDHLIALELIQTVLKFKNIKSGQCLNIEIPEEFLEVNNNFDKFLRAHISCFLYLRKNDTIPNDLFKVLLEIKTYFSSVTWNMSFTEYKNNITDIFLKYVISPINKRVIDNSPIKIDLLTPIERRFLFYDLTILCDLKENIWPPRIEDHFFISEQTRRQYGYNNPSKYEVGYAAYDFASIIASSTQLVFIELNEIEVSNPLEPFSIPSRFLSLLYAYNTIGKFNNNLVQAQKFFTVNKAENHNICNAESMSIPLHQKSTLFSATSLEKLMKNPYLYSVEYNWKLKYLPKSFKSQENLPTSREFGIILHAILHNALSTIPYDVSYEVFLSGFLSIAQNLICERYGKKSQYILTLWQQKIHTIADFMYHYNQDLFLKYDKDLITKTEQNISAYINLNHEIKIQLNAYADRIDYTPNCIHVCDYKTGQIPSKQDIITGLKPQLNLEGLILMLSGIVKPQQNILLRYIKLSFSSEIREIEFNFESTLNGIINILKGLYEQDIPYATTNEYDNYLQAQIMRTLQTIEHKF